MKKVLFAKLGLLLFALTLVLALFVMQDLTVGVASASAAAPAQAASVSGQATPRPYPGSPTNAVDSNNIWYIILIPIVVLLAAIGLGYTLLRLARDNG